MAHNAGTSGLTQQQGVTQAGRATSGQEGSEYQGRLWCGRQEAVSKGMATIGGGSDSEADTASALVLPWLYRLNANLKKVSNMDDTKMEGKVSKKS